MSRKSRERKMKKAGKNLLKQQEMNINFLPAKRFELNILRNETYKQRKIMLFAIISLFLGIYFTLVFYPGVLYSDSYTRWDTAKYILYSAYNFDFSNIHTWVSITPQFFMAFLYALTFNYATFTLIQSILFFFSSFLMIDKFVYNYKIIVLALFIICPIFYGYSVYHEMSTGCIIGINFGILLLTNENLKNWPNWKMILKIVYFSALFLCFYVTFGFRQNAFTIFPAIILTIIYLYKKYKNKLLSILQIAIIGFSLLFVSLFPAILKINVYSSSSAGFVWEILSTIQEMPKDKQAKYNDYLDFISGDGSTSEALVLNSKSGSVNPWLWSIFTVQNIGDKNIRSKIQNRYMYFVFNETNYYLNTKFYFIGRNLGIIQPLNNPEYNYNRREQMHHYGMLDNGLRHWFVNSYNKFQEVTVVFRIPWIWFVIGLLAVIFQFFKAERNHFLGTLLLYLIAIFYYSAFIINTQSFEFRYFFPAFYMLFIITADSIGTIIYDVTNLNKRRTV